MKDKERYAKLNQYILEERLKIKYGDMPSDEIIITARMRALRRIWNEEDASQSN